MFPISARLDEAITQGTLLCGTLWLLFHGSASFIKLRREGDLGQWSKPFARPRAYLASSRAALKSLLLLQTLIAATAGGKMRLDGNMTAMISVQPDFRD